MVIAKSDGIARGTVLDLISDFAAPALGALAVQLFRIPQLLRTLPWCGRCAVLSDAVRIRTAAAIDRALLSGPEIRNFEFDAVEAAETRLKQTLAA